MKQPNKDYQDLHALSKKIHLLEGVNGLLGWDEETYMPKGSAGIRAEQHELLAGLIHKQKTGAPFVKALSKLIDLKKGTIKTKSLMPPQEAALREWRRDYMINKALPTKFVEELAKHSSQSVNAWREARKNDAFLQFAPFLEKTLVMERKKADYFGFKEHPYDALLDKYEPEMTTKEISEVFTPLKNSIVSLLKSITASKQVDDSFLYGKFGDDKQMEFSKVLLEGIGFDLHTGRLDLSTHPFSSSAHPTDNRITTRIHPELFMDCFSGTLHEAGHALYEAGLPVEQYGSPLGSPVSMGMHESQSRWWEKWIGQSKPFWKYFLPKLKKVFPKALDKISLDQFYRAINKIEPSFIRVEADEITYPLHVILRFELEKALIEGSLKVKDLPDAWNAKMKELLGITPKTNREGCLQDIHWSAGYFGYFPTYSLGNMYAAQFFKAFTKKHKDWDKKIEKGDFAFVKEWLYKNVHQYGRQYNSKELIKKASGKVFKQTDYVDYLTDKYKKIYLIK